MNIGEMAAMDIDELRRIFDEDRRSRMSEEGALLDSVLSAVERVANEIPPPSRQAAELFNIVVAARAFHQEYRRAKPNPPSPRVLTKSQDAE